MPITQKHTSASHRVAPLVALLACMAGLLYCDALRPSAAAAYTTRCINQVANLEWVNCNDWIHNWTYGEVSQQPNFPNPYECVGLWNVGVSNCTVNSTLEVWDFGTRYQAYDPLGGVALWSWGNAPGASYGNAIDQLWYGP
jgi:hypothetical protein